MDRYLGSRPLVERAEGGDQAAWAEIYRLVYPRLVSFAQHRLGDLDDSREAVSETMARAIAHIDRYNHNDDGIGPWLFGICRNVVAEALRRRSRFVGSELADRAAIGAEPPDSLLADEEREVVRKAFARLGPHEREILELRVVGRLSSDEVAAVLGMKRTAVRMAQRRALARLRTFVEELERVG